MSSEALSWREAIKALDQCRDDFERVYRSFRQKAEAVEQTEKELQQAKDKLEELESELVSLPVKCKQETARQRTEMSQSETSIKAQCEKSESAQLDAAKSELDARLKQIDQDLKKFKTDIANSESASQDKVKKAEDLVKSEKSAIDEIDRQIKDAQDETTQIRQYQKEIAGDFKGISKNERLKAEFKEPVYDRGDAMQKVESMEPGLLVQTAQKLAKNDYVTNPEFNKLPIKDIFFNIFAVFGVIFSLIGDFFILIYRPITIMEKFTSKLIYGAVVTGVLAAGIFLLFKNFGDLILGGLILIAAALLLLLIVLFVINLIKYRNTAVIAEQNFCFYSVGYCYTYENDDFMFRLSTILFNNLKAEAPNKYNEFILNMQSGLNEELRKHRASLAENERSLSDIRQEHEALKAKNESDRKIKEEEAVREKEQQKNEVYPKKCSSIRENISAEKEKRLSELKRNTEARISACEKELEQAIDRTKRSISDTEYKINDLKEVLARLQGERKELKTNLENTARTSADYHDKLTSGQIECTPIIERKGADSLNPDLLVGFRTGLEREVDGRTLRLREAQYIRSKGKPVVIRCSGFDGDDDQNLSQALYSIADKILVQLMATRSLYSFRLSIVDSKIRDAGLIINDYMKSAGLSSDNVNTLNSNYNNILEMHLGDPTEKTFDKIIDARIRELGGSSIESLNEKNANKDIMVKYIYVCIRASGSDFKFDNLNTLLQNCTDRNGILPILFILDENFNEKSEFIKKAVSQNCDGIYYRLARSGGSHFELTECLIDAL